MAGDGTDAAAMRQVLGRMINSKTSRAWESWQAMIRGRMDALRALRHSMMFGTSNTLARSFRTWSLGLGFLRKDGLLRRAMLALMHRDLQRAVGWTVVYEARCVTVQMMLQVRGRLVYRSLERSWASWMGVLVARAEALQLMQRGLHAS